MCAIREYIARLKVCVFPHLQMKEKSTKKCENEVIWKICDAVILKM